MFRVHFEAGQAKKYCDTANERGRDAWDHTRYIPTILLPQTTIQ
jgi:hypothetical protein